MKDSGDLERTPRFPVKEFDPLYEVRANVSLYGVPDSKESRRLQFGSLYFRFSLL